MRITRLLKVRFEHAACVKVTLKARVTAQSGTANARVLRVNAALTRERGQREF